MKRSIKLNYILNMSYQCLTILIPLSTTPYLSRVLGAEGVGANSYVISMASYFTLFAIMGSGTYAQRKVASYQDDKHMRSVVFWDVLLFRVITTVVASLSYIGYLLVLKPNNLLISQIYLIYILCVAFDVTWFYQGMEDFVTVVGRNLLIRIVNVVVIFTFVKTSSDLPIYCLSFVGLTIMANIWTLFLMPKYIEKVAISEVRPFRELKDILVLFVPTIAIQMYTLLDKTMIGWFSTGSAENGYFNQTENMVKMCLMVITSLCTVMLPRMSKWFAEGNKNQFNYYLKKSYSFAWLLSIPMSLGMISIATTFVPVFFGPGYDKSIILMYILAPIIIAISMSSITGNQLLLPSHLHKEYNISVITGAFVNLVINLIMIPRFHSIGAAVGTLVAEVLVSTVQLILCRKKGVLEFKTVFGSASRYLLAGGCMFVALLFIKRFLEINALGLIVLIVAGGVIYLIALLAMKDSLVVDTLHSVLGKSDERKK
ncbi:oligosaccharide flippase family protein [Parasporobacterium paucivorans]|uniref:Membrane protein involved in the export of O-antigen and teichoic acid n=1 Tax=Parasporobacterium paucivorans DSM 15970 TaxID=1122934 RepID=A0A1M6EAK3_9FIRM|nr:oligosaccharide flippase family protein [Parasporobacterium paucivorans]SHI82318.1 Membrane protein involved in the export of O-antigen and teichoic acid [Parasporobacterium paucivorans DSM 15970]